MVKHDQKLIVQTGKVDEAHLFLNSVFLLNIWDRQERERVDCIRLSCIVFSDPIVALIQRLMLLILAGSDIEGGAWL